jgi:hypothetical protein
MAQTTALADRGYRFAPYAMQYSGGVAAEPGHRLARVRFARVAPMQEGWRAIAAWLDSHGLPRTAFVACELRSPAPFTDQGFLDFNKGYHAVLKDWGVLSPEGRNPVARSNVCPELDPPASPGFHAFTVCLPGAGEGGTSGGFVVSGSGEAREGEGTYAERTIALGDVSEAGMRAKCHFVLEEMERRMGRLGVGWADVTATQVYTIYEMAPLMAHLIVPRGAAAHGITWHFARPPVVGLDFEVDVRRVGEERVIAG